MSVVDDEFSVEGELLLERNVDGDDAFLTNNVTAFADKCLANFKAHYRGEQCRITVILDRGLLISRNFSREEELIHWERLKIAHALTPCFTTGLKNVLLLCSQDKQYLFNLLDQNASTFASFLRLDDSTKRNMSSNFDADTAILTRYLEDLEHFSIMETPMLDNLLVKLQHIDIDIMEVMERKNRKMTFGDKVRKYFHRICNNNDSLQDFLLHRKHILELISSRKDMIRELLMMIRHAFIILARTQHPPEYDSRFILHFSGLVRHAKIISTPRPLPGSADVYFTPTVTFDLIDSVNCPPLTWQAVCLIQNLLYLSPTLAVDWRYLGPSWKHWKVRGGNYEVDDWSLVKQQKLQMLGREIDGLRHNMNIAYRKMVDRHLIAEVDETRYRFEEKRRSVEQIKNRSSRDEYFNSQRHRKSAVFVGHEKGSTIPGRLQSEVQMSFTQELKERNARIAIALSTELHGTHGKKMQIPYLEVYEKERLEIIAFVADGQNVQVRNADGEIGLLPKHRVMEINFE